MGTPQTETNGKKGCKERSQRLDRALGTHLKHAASGVYQLHTALARENDCVWSSDPDKCRRAMAFQSCLTLSQSRMHLHVLYPCTYARMESLAPQPPTHIFLSCILRLASKVEVEGALQHSTITTSEGVNFHSDSPLREIFEADCEDANIRSLPTDILHCCCVASAIRVEHTVSYPPIVEVDLSSRTVDNYVLK